MLPLNLYKIAINNIPLLGPISIRKIIHEIGSVEGFFEEKIETLAKIEGIGLAKFKNYNQKKLLEEAEEELKFIKTNSIKITNFLDKDYPKKLNECVDGPISLYYKGTLPNSTQKHISIVGTRNASAYGIDFCKKLIKDLKDKNYSTSIISGLAFGIDSSAHKACIDHSLHTTAILGHGLNLIYPAAHNYLANQIVNNGCLITEFPSNVLRLKSNFVRRNRIIAGMSDAVIIVETDIKGGSIITAELANSYNKDVFALPGRYYDKKSSGCNNLIKQNKAILIENLEDLEYFMDWTTAQTSIQTKLFPELSEIEQKIYDTIASTNKVNIDELCYKTQIPIHKLTSILTQMEFSGIIKSFPGKIFQVII